MKKKCLALLLTLCLSCTLLPAPALAAGDSLNPSSKEYKELIEFLNPICDWVGSYSAEGAFFAYPEMSILETLIQVPTSNCCDDSLYPGEPWEDAWDQTDPLGKMDSYLKTNAQKIDWILEHIFNCPKAQIEKMKAAALTTPIDRRASSGGGYNYFGKNNPYNNSCAFYYLDGYYYSYLGGVGGPGYTLSIKETKKAGDKYQVFFDALFDVREMNDLDTPYYALVERKTIDGKEYWSLYHISKLNAGQNPLETGGFVDVASNAYYRQSVLWAVDKDITAGTGWASFSPNRTCTKGQILTFLWRAQGQPKAAAANPFRDITASDYFYQAALWAAEQGIVSGTSFNGNEPCTRAMAVTYLWKLAGSPAGSAAGFQDVPAGADYAQAVAWAVNSGVTSGTANDAFSPAAVCTRGQIVTFLYRAMEAPLAHR